ncbi:ABC transporter G family member 36 [Hibiscus syriacus]|uniref:ABC transporter G family member 36 n=1 Tax=Hibiscus syriacus TaxID=106335 RepID=A0A6A2XSJ4_HIBSY|nr:ABC transporter G family member 36 [Hibiscus syriacus]
MDGLQRAGNPNKRIGISSIGRSISRSSWIMEDVFSASKHSSRSRRVDEDEEALKWAAIERLPTYDRLRTSVMQSFVDHEIIGKKLEDRQVDVTKLDMNDRQKFMDMHFKVAEEDNEKYLKKFRNRIDRVGIKLPTVEVRFDHLTVEADCYIGSRALPSLTNVARNIAESALAVLGIKLAKTTNLTILKDVSGIVKPSRMTLLLGPPSSGKTTLLLALAGKLDESLRVEGDVTYNGYSLDEFVPKKTSAYISQNDVHVGEMTVQETLDFSARCQGVGTRYDLLKELARREKEAGIFPEADVDLFMKATAMEGVESSLITDYTLKLLGLDICKDTIVGDEMHRGVSGGQKKRVTTGEMIVGPSKTLFMDEISTGLDSSTTYQIVKCLQQIVHLTEATIFESLLQPAPETFDLFDDIILLSEGKALLTSYKRLLQRRIKNNIGQIEASHTDTSQRVNLQAGSRASMSECNSITSSLCLSTSREDTNQHWLSKNSQSLKRNSLKPVGTKNGTNVGALIFGMAINMFNGLSELSLMINRLPVFYKQRDLLFHPAWTYTLPSFLLRVPISILEYVVWVAVTYYTIGFVPEASRSIELQFFNQLMLVFLTQKMAARFFRLIAGLCRTMVIANTGGALTLLLVFLLGGFIVPKREIPNWWEWAYWVSPLSYGYNAFTVNEMFDPRLMNKLASDNVTPLGVQLLRNYDVPNNENWYWIGAGVLFGFTVLFNVLFTFALTYLNRKFQHSLD